MGVVGRRRDLGRRVLQRLRHRLGAMLVGLRVDALDLQRRSQRAGLSSSAAKRPKPTSESSSPDATHGPPSMLDALRAGTKHSSGVTSESRLVDCSKRRRNWVQGLGQMIARYLVRVCGAPEAQVRLSRCGQFTPRTRAIAVGQAPPLSATDPRGAAVAAARLRGSADGSRCCGV